jgi:hypothetical protein
MNVGITTASATIHGLMTRGVAFAIGAAIVADAVLTALRQARAG